MPRSIREFVRMAERERAEADHPFQRFCNECGEQTLNACGSCKGAIRTGRWPAWCGNCGQPFPWTETALQAAREYTDELEELNTDEKAILKATFIDLTIDSPKTKLAASRFKRVLRKVGPDAGKAIKDMIVEIASSTAAKLISG